MNSSPWTARCVLLVFLVGQLALSGCLSHETNDKLFGKKKSAPVARADHPKSEHPKSEHPKSEHPKSEHPTKTPAASQQPVGAGLVRSAMAFPSAVSAGAGEKDCCAKIVLEKTAPAEVAVGQPFDYVIKATNRGNIEVRDVVVRDQLPDNFTIISSNPPAAGGASWNLGSLSPNQSKTVTVKGKANGPGQLVNCSTVSYTPYICVTTSVVQPALKLTKSMPSEVLLCDPIPVKLVVTNTGTGAVRDVVIKDELPAGLVTSENRRTVVANVGTLAAGQSRAFTATLKATRRGEYRNTSVATGSGGTRSEASASTVVREPVLTLSQKCPGTVYIGRQVCSDLSVSNTGDGVAKNTIVTASIPAGAQFISASSGGVSSGGQVTWNLGTLAPSASRNLQVCYKAAQAGTLSTSSSAKAYCAKTVTAGCKTDVAGIPAILLEVIDQNDPVQIGSNEVYTITATNQGSADGKNVTIVCQLEDNAQHVSSTGATRGSLAGGTVKFAPLPRLAPEAKATWKVTVKAVKTGDVRFKVTMTEDRLTRPVEETEATNFYE